MMKLGETVVAGCGSGLGPTVPICVFRGEIMRKAIARRLLMGVALAAVTGCGGDRGGANEGPRQQVVVYSALDREFAEPVATFRAKDGTWYGFAARARIHREPGGLGTLLEDT
jgi:hypothetical protein